MLARPMNSLTRYLKWLFFPKSIQVLIPTDDVEGESTGLYGDNGGKGASSFSSPSSPFLPRELFFELPAEYGKCAAQQIYIICHACSCSHQNTHTHMLFFLL